MNDTPETKSVAGDRLANEFADEKPDHDALMRAQVRAKLNATLFGVTPDPVRLGRFVILDRLGQGGMGVVYSAYDPQLDRRVALKLIRTENGRAGDDERQSRAHARLLREAQALARLSHPNVVPVHDVGVLDNRVFIVMEFVVGQTLDSWVERQPRSWREIVDVYRQAAEGLAAAHAVDIVHRDFKPANAIVGEDGRVRVVDFGLARSVAGNDADDDAGRTVPDQSTRPDGNREASTDRIERASALSRQNGDRSDSQLDIETASVEDAEADHLDDTRDPQRIPFANTLTHSNSPAAVSDAPTDNAARPGPAISPMLNVPLTGVGAVLGTPAFMSPEQIIGANVDAASDQFSFCVSLYRALYRQHPFAGNDLGTLRRNVLRGNICEPEDTHRVPGWVHAIVVRGMQIKLTDRYPSMNALIVDLARDPARVRVRWLLAFAFATLVVLLVLSFTRTGKSDEVEPCQVADLTGVWDEPRRVDVQRAILAVEQPQASALASQVTTGLDEYATAWTNMEQKACLDHQSGRQSGLLLDKRIACLERRRVALNSAVQVLVETDETSFINALKVVHSLPNIDYCANLEALAAQVPPPEDEQVARRVATLRESLGRARALEDMGRYDESLALSAQVTAVAETVGYPPVHAESLLSEGRVLLAKNEMSKSIPPLRRAAQVAFAAQADSLALDAHARRLFSEGHEEIDRPMDGLSMVEALSERLPHDTFGRALLLNNIGAVYLLKGEQNTARSYLERALAVRDSNPDHVELTAIPLNLAKLTSDEQQRTTLLRTALDERIRTLGASHPFTLQFQVVYGRAISDPVHARSIIEPVCTQYRELYPTSVARRAYCDYSLAFLEAELNEKQPAAARLHRVAELVAQGNQPAFLKRLGTLAAGYAHLYGRDNKAVMVPLADLLEQLREKQTWFMQVLLAKVQLGRGVSMYRRGEATGAIDALEHALMLFERNAQHTPSAERHRFENWARMTLAQALSDVSRQQRGEASDATKNRARALLSQAEAWYRAAGHGYEWRLQALAEWRATHMPAANAVRDWEGEEE